MTFGVALLMLSTLAMAVTDVAAQAPMNLDDLVPRGNQYLHP